MAKQIAGLCSFEGTFDDITFYKMDGQYYARAKSSLSSKRVKTSPEFKWTMVYARLLARASKIGSQVYKALPPGWRQFWMYRSFTGEAFTLLKENAYTDEEVKQLLWKCYVEYWEQQKAADPDNPIFQPKPQKIRKRRKYSQESIQRLLKRKDKNGKPKWRDPEEEERKRLAKERNAAAYARLLEKEKQLAQQNLEQADQQPKGGPTLSQWVITQDGLITLTKRPPETRRDALEITSQNQNSIPRIPPRNFRIIPQTPPPIGYIA
ncbi:hypothetical protein HB364_28465 [Pseudoflavitalea sp. X16]|uniref:hypothetical protein n=1 Tax=Paraflavitalea devenefica TaxID=2716334 RepID=UPI0014200F4F|nr:hypothetical protein [Paraflavitalea devenefica]NII29046.1 hypothetical protein [Paraflavitalea devenefica]